MPHHGLEAIIVACTIFCIAIGQARSTCPSDDRSEEFDLDLALLAQLHRVQFAQIPVTPATKRVAEQRLLDLIEETRAEYVVLARYMQVLCADLGGRLSVHVINIHHSFLRSFKGAKHYHRA